MQVGEGAGPEDERRVESQTRGAEEAAAAENRTRTGRDATQLAAARARGL